MLPRALVPLFLFLLPSLAGAATLEITNPNDAGPGSLRAALEAARDGDRIEFRIPAPVPERGWFTIRLESLLPYVTRKDVTIDATTQTALTGDTNPFGPEIEIDGSRAGHGPGLKFVDSVRTKLIGLTINGFSGNGVVVERGGAVDIIGNVIGCDPTGTARRANGLNGVLFIGAAGARLTGNIVSGNEGNGVYIYNSNVEISGNRIGAGRTTEHVLGNGANGIHAATYVTIIEGNTITFNRDHGITLADNARMVNIVRNAIWGNGYLSIDAGHDGVDGEDPLDLDGGANGHMNPPVLTSARVTAAGTLAVSGSIRTVPNHGIVFNAYASPHRSRLGLGEARVTIAGFDRPTNAQGFAAFSFDNKDYPYPVPFIPGGYVVATAYAPGAREGTSELSAPIPIEPPPNSFEVTTTADSGRGSLRAAIDASNAAGCSSAAPCWISFHLPEEEIRNGVVVLEPESPLPAIAADHVNVVGETQAYWTNAARVEIRGSRAGANATGLRIGSAESPLSFVSVTGLSIRDFSGDGIVTYQRRTPNGALFLGRSEITGNGGNGVVLHGGSGTNSWYMGEGYGSPRRR